MLVRWNLTVCSATQSSFEIASFERPRATARTIPSSRSVSPASFAARSPGSSVMPAVVKTFPSRACRRAPARSSGSIDLTMYAFAPRFNAVWISSGSCDTDRIATFMSGNSFRIFVRQVRPSICGMRRSSSTRSGFSLRMSGRTCAPLTASPTTSKPPARSRACFVPSTINRWSSAIKTRTHV